MAQERIKEADRLRRENEDLKARVKELEAQLVKKNKGGK